MLLLYQIADSTQPPTLLATQSKPKMAKNTDTVILPAKTLFVRPSALPTMTASPGKKYVDVGYEICEAMRMVKNVKPYNVNGSTKIRGLWRLDLKGENSHLARASILASGLTIRGHMVPVLSRNPNLVDGEETSRLYITNLPFSVSNDAVKSALMELGLQLGSEGVQWEMYRNDANDMSSYKNGKRYIYIAPPRMAIPRSIKVAGKFDAFLNYKGPLPKTGILLDKQEEDKKNRNGSEDSDSDTDLDDNDTVLKGLKQTTGPQGGFAPAKPKRIKPIKRQQGASAHVGTAPINSPLEVSDLDQTTPEDVSGVVLGRGKSVVGLLGDPNIINEKDTVQQTTEHISEVPEEQHSNSTSAYDRDTEADSESEEAKTVKQQLDSKILPKDLGLKQYKTTRSRNAERLASNTTRHRSASSNKRKHESVQSETTGKTQKTGVNKPTAGSAVVIDNKETTPVKSSKNSLNANLNDDWYEMYTRI